MVLGISIAAFTTFHVAISLLALAAGVGVLAGFIKNADYPYWTPAFLVLTIATSATGFMFPATQLLPSHMVGILSTVILAATVIAYYVFHLAGAWRWIYVVGSVTAFYLNAFVAVVQSFLKIPTLHALAPQGTELPFVIAQTALLIVFFALGILAVRNFKPVAGALSLETA